MTNSLSDQWPNLGDQGRLSVMPVCRRKGQRHGHPLSDVAAVASGQEDHPSMAVNDWLPVATTALGGLIAAGGGWLAQWASSRNSDKRIREERRHSAYGAFIAASKELPVLAREANVADTEEERRWLDEVITLARAITRTCVDVTLAGPLSAAEAADAVQRKAWQIVSTLDPRMGADDEDFDAVLNEYRSRCNQFDAVALATLHTTD